jgi:hypothetical protein
MYVLDTSVADRDRVNAELDPDPNFHLIANVYPDPDPDCHKNDADPHADPMILPQVLHRLESEISFYFLSYNIASLQWFVSVECVIFYSILDSK